MERTVSTGEVTNLERDVIDTREVGFLTKPVDITNAEPFASSARRRVAFASLVTGSYVVALGIVAWVTWTLSSAAQWLILLPVVAAVFVVLARRVDSIARSQWDEMAEVARLFGFVGVVLGPAAISSGWISMHLTSLSTAALTALGVGYVVRRFRRSHPRRAILVGDSSELELLDIEIGSVPGLEVSGRFNIAEGSNRRVRSAREVSAVARAVDTEAIIFGLRPSDSDAVVVETRRSLPSSIPILVVRDPHAPRRQWHVADIEIGGVPLDRVPPRHTERAAWRVKRAVDVVLSLLLLVISAPVLGLIAVAVRRSSEGPILFRQERLGIDQRSFEILKFRTMRMNSDGDTRWSVESDPRVTRVGAFLRTSHLDELPQLINVLRGEMTLIGPRPERPFFVDKFLDTVEGYDRRFEVPQGITGWSQVNGLWGDTSIDARARFDRQYVERWSLSRDFAIFLGTLPTLFKSRSG